MFGQGMPWEQRFNIDNDFRFNEKVVAVVALITPELAREMLNHAAPNRKINRHVIEGVKLGHIKFFWLTANHDKIPDHIRQAWEASNNQQ